MEGMSQASLRGLMLIETPQGTWTSKVVLGGRDRVEQSLGLPDAVTKVVAHAVLPPSDDGFHPPGGRLFDQPTLYDHLFGWDPRVELDFITSMTEVGRLVEFGCGSGRMLIPLLERGYQVDGVDSSSAALNHLAVKVGRRRRGGVPNLVLGDLAEVALLPCYPAAFAALNTMRYLPSMDAAAAHLRRAAMSVEAGGRYLVHVASFGTDLVERPHPGAYIEWEGFGDSDKKVRVRWELAKRQPRRGYDLEIERIRVWCDGKPIIDELQSQLSLAISGWCTLFTSEGLWSVCGVVDADQLEPLDAQHQRRAASGNYWFVLDRTDLAAPALYDA